MERLTKYGDTSHENKVCCIHFMGKECTEHSGHCSDNCPWEEAAWSKLAAYEDTGLEPEEIEKLCDMDRRAKMAEMLRDEEKNGISTDRLRELVEADKDGRCVVLPVEVGQNVYFINQPLDSEICTAIVIGAEINLYTPSCPIWLEIEWFSPTLGKHKYHSRADLMIGKTVFLTREAAEEALRREQDDEEHHIL